jgi:hypothetical protein
MATEKTPGKDDKKEKVEARERGNRTAENRKYGVRGGKGNTGMRHVTL